MQCADIENREEKRHFGKPISAPMNERAWTEHEHEQGAWMKNCVRERVRECRVWVKEKVNEWMYERASERSEWTEVCGNVAEREELHVCLFVWVCVRVCLKGYPGQRIFYCFRYKYAKFKECAGSSLGPRDKGKTIHVRSASRAVELRRLLHQRLGNMASGNT